MHVPRKFRDLVPEPLRPVLPHVTSVILRVTAPFRTAANAFGLYRIFPRGKPAHDPDPARLLAELQKPPAASADAAPQQPPPLGPYPNVSSALFNDFWWNHGHLKSLDSRDKFLELLRTPGFDAADLLATNFGKVEDTLAGDFESFGDGWNSHTVTINVPLGKGKDAVPIDIPGLQTRSLVNTFVHQLSTDPAVATWQWAPQTLMHRTSKAKGADRTRVHGEVWNSPRFRKLHDDVQRLPLEPDSDASLPRCVLALMPGSDGTHLAQFGSASAWPGYMGYGNLSKYLRGKRTADPLHHCISFPKLPDGFNDTLKTLGVTQSSVKKNILTHCRRELSQAAWRHLLDPQFMHAYRYGVVIKCSDGVTRRIYPRFFTYTADYPEKMLMATLKDNGSCPCPRCLVKKDDIHLVGTDEDLRTRRDDIRLHDSIWTRAVTAARNLFMKGITVFNSKRVNDLLRPKSLVPTLNAFSVLKTIDPTFSVFSLFTVDLLHEIELGIWKALLIHLLRILQAADSQLLDELNERFRKIPAFGRSTIRRFVNNVSELKQLAGHNFEDILQCAIPAFEGLLPPEHDAVVMNLLYILAEWHGLAKLRMHTDATLDALDTATTDLCNQLRNFVSTTCAAYKTSELPRERAARARKDAKKPPSEQADETHREPKEKTFNMNTYKMHSIPDYAPTIREYGTIDSYTTMLYENAHPELKARYRRTNKRNAITQMGRMERIQANTHVIVKGLHPKPAAMDVGIDEDGIPLTAPADHHAIGGSAKGAVDIGDWAERHREVKDIANKLRDHLLTRLLGRDYDGDEAVYSTEDRLRVYLVRDRIYTHKIMSINYTTYDVRRGRDIVHVGTDKSDIMLLSCEQGEGSHPFWYARVIGMYHVLAKLNDGAKKPQLFHFLLVRWFGRDEANDSRSALTRVGWDETNEYGFVDPAHVLRACHIVPAFAHGLAASRTARSIPRDPSRPDYNYYYVMKWSDRDLLMRFLGGGIGHRVGLTKPYSSQPGTAIEESESEESEEEVDEGDADDDEVELPTGPAFEMHDSDTDADGAEIGADDNIEGDPGEESEDDEEDIWDEDDEAEDMGMVDDGADEDYGD
ncbi:hypothetical protein AURDEDRAFT_164853 [Auricularia subglabra TFB-10046 SS5]|nr:hypothetical protein AURDEDRAFT_164853 [Auricularia subglabra TFB-10046 SS5]